MNDLEKWKVRGPVHSLSTEFAEWDLTQEEWRSVRRLPSATFHPHGRLDESRHYNPDGAIARHKCLYDQVGRLIETQFSIDGALSHKTLYFYDNAGRRIRTVGLSPDGQQQDIEASTYDSIGRKTTIRFLFPHAPDSAVLYGIEGVDHAYTAPVRSPCQSLMTPKIYPRNFCSTMPRTP